MPLTPAQRLVIGEHLSAWDRKMGIVARGLSFGNERLAKLGQYELYVEDVIVHAQMIEHSTKLLLKGYGCKGDILRTLRENNPYEGINLHKLDDDTLGELVGKLKSVNSSTSLISKLSRLNVMRKEVIHHLFDGNRDIEKADKDAKNYVVNELPELIQEIKKGVNGVSKEIRELVNAYDSSLVHLNGDKPLKVD